MTPAALSEVLAAAFAARRPSYANERELQHRIGVELINALRTDPTDLVFSPEHRFDARDRVDFFVRGVAVEVKVGGSLAAATRQLFRYAAQPSVTGVLLVTTRYAHRALPETMEGKPVGVLCLAGYLL